MKPTKIAGYGPRNIQAKMNAITGMIKKFRNQAMAKKRMFFIEWNICLNDAPSTRLKISMTSAT